MATVPIVTELTYAEAAALIASGDLNLALGYKITDRGDNGLLFRAAAPDRLESDGLRYMLCPTTYQADYTDDNDNHWIGVWNTTRGAAAVENDLTIWNGLVWKAGAVLSGDAPDQEGSGWTVIPKATFANGEYIEMIFGVTYDFEGDWIDKQWDNSGNVFGLTKDMYEYVYSPGGDYPNIVDYCDWNLATGGYVFANNRCFYICNNSNSGDIYTNSNSGEISNNSNNGEISNNSNGGEIYNNSSTAACSITRNINNGEITGVWNSDVTDTVVDKVGTAE